MQAGSELIGREMACSCLGTAAQYFELGAPLFIFCPPLGEVLSWPLAHLTQSHIGTSWASNTSNDRQETSSHVSSLSPGL